MNALQYVNVIELAAHGWFALRAIFYPEFDINELAAHVYLHSVHNITIKHSWLRLQLDWGDNVYEFFMKGVEEGIYNSSIPKQ